jgi:hypothetical protein
MVGIYFLLLVAWGISGNLSAGTPLLDTAISAIRLTALGVAALALLGLFAWLVARTTIYTITTRRVVIRFGIALPMTIQIAFPTIDAAGLHLWADGAGDISLALRPGLRVAYLVLWPHTRPWKLAKAEPTLRCVPDAAAVGQLLGRALAASAAQPAKHVSIPAGVIGDSRAQVPAAA